MNSLLNSKLIQILLFVLIISGIGWVFYDSFFAAPDTQDRNEVNVVLLGSQQKKFESVTQERGIKLPEDFQFHPGYQHEWWHFFANVKDEQGRRYGIQWSFFRVATGDREAPGWRNPQLFISHLVVTSEKQIWKEQRIARGGIGQAGMTPSPFKIWIDNWHWKSLGRTPFPGRLDVETDDFSVHLANYAAGPFVLNGENGYQAKHDQLELASFSVSAPFIRTKGYLTLGTEKLSIEGQAWLSKEWGSGLLAEGQQGWDLFALRLDKQQTLMVNHYRHNSQSPYTFGTLANRKGDTVTLTRDQIKVTVIDTHKLSNGRVVPLKWRVQVPEHDIDLTISPVRKEQWLPFVIPYWEGPVTGQGSHQATGLMQLTGY